MTITMNQKLGLILEHEDNTLSLLPDFPLRGSAGGPLQLRLREGAANDFATLTLTPEMTRVLAAWLNTWMQEEQV